MMRRWMLVETVVGVLVLVAATPGAAVAAPAGVTPLSRGCNQVVSTFADGTSPAAIAAAVTPAVALQAIWRLDNAGGRLAGWSPAPAAPVDLTAVNRLDPLWLCVTAAAQLTQPDADAGPLLRCTARALPVGRSANVWSVECNLTGAPAGDTGFTVVTFEAGGPALCSGALAGGAGACGGTVSVPLDTNTPPRPLRFYARTSPSGATAADLNPEMRALR